MVRRTPILSVCLMLTGLFTGGCASTSLTVERAGPQVNGVRYSLPEPFLLVKPSPEGDGTFTVEVVYLPNQDKTYAVSGKTHRGKFSLSVETEEGLLKKLSWNATGSAEHDAAIAKNASDLAKSAVDKRATDNQKKETDAEAKRKELDADVKSATKDAEDKALEAKLAELELASAKNAVVNKDKPTDEEKAAIRAAQLKLDKANEAKNDADERLRKRQADRLAAGNGPGGGAAANAPMGQAGQTAKPVFYGPMLYRIKDTGERVDLVPVVWDKKDPESYQLKMETALVTAPVAGAGGASTVTLKFIDSARSGSKVTVHFEASPAVKTIDKDQINFLLGGVGVGVKPTSTIEADGKKVTLVFATLTAGDYEYVIRGTTKDDKEFVAVGKVTIK